MPIRSLRPCSAPRCPELVQRGRCAGHSRQREATRGSAHARGYGRSWRKLRDHVLAYEPICRICAAEGRVTAATDVDHLIPKRLGGMDDCLNLQPLCKACHSRLTVRHDGGFGRPMTERGEGAG